MPEFNNKKFLTTEEVATGYGLSAGHLANLRCKKLGPKYFRVSPRKILYSVADVENWVKSSPVFTRECIE